MPATAEPEPRAAGVILPFVVLTKANPRSLGEARIGLCTPFSSCNKNGLWLLNHWSCLHPISEVISDSKAFLQAIDSSRPPILSNNTPLSW